MEPLGPFAVTSEQIERARTSFTAIINSLLALERARAGMQGHLFRLDSQDETADGGVDAQIMADVATTWVPDGPSAWQFKRGDLPPSKCEDEIAGATWAQELLQRGAKYRLVLGRRLTPRKVNNRRKALLDKLHALGLRLDESHVQVLDANSLAQWASEFPALAISPVLQGAAYPAQDFERWSASNRHQDKWVDSERRKTIIDQIHTLLDSSSQYDIRIDGVQGIGKTRAVMEALRGDARRDLVAYIPDERDARTALFNDLLTQERAVILVVDECPARRHEKLAELIPADATIRLITIGEPENYPLRSAKLTAAELEGDTIERFLALNYPRLWVEARRFVRDHCIGNPYWAIVLARKVLETDRRHAGVLIDRNDIDEFVTSLLPEGRDFLAVAALALFERVGWDRELRYQAEAIAAYAGTTVSELEHLIRSLARRGLIVKQGRYRTISPHPLAVYLAAEVWRDDGHRVVDELLPLLDQDMAEAFFMRLAQIGPFRPATQAVAQFLSESPKLASIQAIARSGLGPVLAHLAVVAPAELAGHLSRLIESTELQVLKESTSLRRDLVWALEKLAWHSSTFERAADTLLRLALAENETYANNATGTWFALFGAVLPTTAASPGQRLSYLTASASSNDSQVRLLTSSALEYALTGNEMVMVSGEVQEGAVVEPRGGVKTLGEAREYRKSLFTLLDGLRRDPDSRVEEHANLTLIEKSFQLLKDPTTRPEVMSVLLSLTGVYRLQLRSKIARIRTLMARTENSEEMAYLDDLEGALRDENPIDELGTLLDMNVWDLHEVEPRQKFESAVIAVLNEDGIERLKELLGERAIPSAGILGEVLGVRTNGDEAILEQLLSAGRDDNLAVVAGFLTATWRAGDEAAFDRFLAKHSSDLSAIDKLFLTVRGPNSPKALQRLLSVSREAPANRAPYMFVGWAAQLPTDQVNDFLDVWLARIDGQEAYNAVIDWLALQLHGRQDLEGLRSAEVMAVLQRRSDYSAVGNARSAWSRIAGLVGVTNPRDVTAMILGLANRDHLLLAEYADEAKVTCALAGRAPAEVLSLVGDRLEAGEWWLMMTLRGWFTNCIAASVMVEWIGLSEARAELIAGIADVGETEPTELAIFLLDNFGSNAKVRTDLAAELQSGTWFGNWSDRLAGQIDHLLRWHDNQSYPRALRTWALELANDLRRQREYVIEREQEERR